jgi:NADP-dependent 3-hydroxy acid dehydrogenase YdfG
MDRIEGRTAFVTGGASGIGLATAEVLVAAGARVVLADWDAEALERESARLGAAALAQHLDVRDRAALGEAKQVAEKVFGPVEILFNNAGVGPGQDELADMPPEHFDKLVSIMLTGIFNGIHTFAAGMRDRGEGHIVNTASMAGLVASPRIGAYTTAKFAVVGLSEVLRAEMIPHGVGVSVLCPGLVQTNIGLHDLRGSEAEAGRAILAQGIDPSLVGHQVLEAIRSNELYVITHGEYGSSVADRSARLQRAFDSAPIRGDAGHLPGTELAED